MKEPTEIEEIFSRLQMGASVKSSTDLARVLGVARQSVFNAQARGKIPDAWFRKIADLNNISIDWLTYGTGSMYREGNTDSDNSILQTAKPKSKIINFDPAIQLVNEAIDEVGIELNEKQKQAIVDIMRDELMARAANLAKAIKGV